MRWVGCTGEMRNLYTVLVVKHKITNCFGDEDCDWMMVLKWAVNKWGVKLCTEFVWLRIWTSGRLCEHGNEPLRSVRGGESLH
jgi:hypothetical protein